MRSVSLEVYNKPKIRPMLVHKKKHDIIMDLADPIFSLGEIAAIHMIIYERFQCR